MKKKKKQVEPPDGKQEEQEKGQVEKVNLEELNRQVEDTSGIMRDNLHKIVVRGEKLEDLESRAQNLEDGAKVFQKTCRKVKHKQRLRKNKWLFVGIGTVSLAVFVIVIIVVILSLKPWEEDE